MIFPYSEVHEMIRKGNIFTCPDCPETKRWDGNKLITLKVGDIHARHFYYSEGMKLSVEVRPDK